MVLTRVGSHFLGSATVSWASAACLALRASRCIKGMGLQGTRRALSLWSDVKAEPGSVRSPRWLSPRTMVFTALSGPVRFLCFSKVPTASDFQHDLGCRLLCLGPVSSQLECSVHRL